MRVDHFFQLLDAISPRPDYLLLEAALCLAISNATRRGGPCYTFRKCDIGQYLKRYASTRLPTSKSLDRQKSISRNEYQRAILYESPKNDRESVDQPQLPVVGDLTSRKIGLSLRAAFSCQSTSLMPEVEGKTLLLR